MQQIFSRLLIILPPFSNVIMKIIWIITARYYLLSIFRTVGSLTKLIRMISHLSSLLPLATLLRSHHLLGVHEVLRNMLPCPRTLTDLVDPHLNLEEYKVEPTVSFVSNHFLLVES